MDSLNVLLLLTTHVRHAVATFVALAGLALVTAGAAAQGSSGGVVVTGALRAETGEVLPYTQVQACSRTLCLYGETDRRGAFRFELPAKRSDFVIKTLEEPAARPRRAMALAPILRGVAHAPVHMGAVYVPDLPEVRPLPAARSGPQTVGAGNGLELTLIGEHLSPPAGRAIAGVGARRIAPSRIPSYNLPRGETIVAVYALHPAGATSRSPIAVKIPSSLAPGTPVRFRTVGDADGILSAPVPGRATGTHVATDPGHGITALTHVVITR